MTPDSPDLVFLGTSVVSGTATAVVFATGRGHGVRGHRRASGGASGGDGVRARDPPVRDADPSDGALPRALHSGRQPHRRSRSPSVAALLRGPGGWTDPRVPADDHHGHARAGCDPDGPGEGDREAPLRDSEPREHRHPVQRQDRHADSRCVITGTLDRPAGSRVGPAVVCGGPQQPAADRGEEPARRGHSRTSQGRSRAVHEDRRNPVRLRAATRVGRCRATRLISVDYQGRAGGSPARVFDLRGRRDDPTSRRCLACPLPRDIPGSRANRDFGPLPWPSGQSRGRPGSRPPTSASSRSSDSSPSPTL